MQIIYTKNQKQFIVSDKMNVCIFENESYLNKKVILPKQVHGNGIIKIENGRENLENTDGMFTENKELVLGIGTSDCASICLSDGEKIGIVHVGWRGLIVGILQNIVSNFRKESLTLYIGPFLHSFEIKKDFCYKEINEKFGDKFFYEENGKIFFNFKEALVNVLPSDTIWDSRNTKDDLSLPSNRRGQKYNFITTVEFLK